MDVEEILRAEFREQTPFEHRRMVILAAMEQVRRCRDSLDEDHFVDVARYFAQLAIREADLQVRHPEIWDWYWRAYELAQAAEEEAPHTEAWRTLTEHSANCVERFTQEQLRLHQTDPAFPAFDGYFASWFRFYLDIAESAHSEWASATSPKTRSGRPEDPFGGLGEDEWRRRMEEVDRLRREDRLTVAQAVARMEWTVPTYYRYQARFRAMKTDPPSEDRAS